MTTIHTTHSTSSPEAPWSNGHREIAVACATKLLDKCEGKYNDRFMEALLEWNNNPRADGYTPAAMFNGRLVSTDLPQLAERDGEPIDQAAATAAHQRTAAGKEEYYNKHAHDLEPPSPGQPVVIFDKKKLRDGPNLAPSTHSMTLI